MRKGGGVQILWKNDNYNIFYKCFMAMLHVHAVAYTQVIITYLLSHLTNQQGCHKLCLNTQNYVRRPQNDTKNNKKQQLNYCCSVQKYCYNMKTIPLHTKTNHNTIVISQISSFVLVFLMFSVAFHFSLWPFKRNNFDGFLIIRYFYTNLLNA